MRDPATTLPTGTPPRFSRWAATARTLAFLAALAPLATPSHAAPALPEAPRAATSTPTAPFPGTSTLPDALPAPALPSALPSAPSALPSAPSALPSATVRVLRTPAFLIHASRDGLSPEQRADAASAALRRAAEEGGSAEVKVETQGDTALIVVGNRPVLELGPEDALAAGDPSAHAYAVRIAPQLRDALRKERSRSATLITLLSFALVVFSGLLALFLIRRAGSLADATRTWIAQHPERVPAIRLRSIEVIRPASLRAALNIGVGASKALAQIGVAYGWVLITLSLFEPTRIYAEQLTGFVFGPLYALLVRLVGALPLLIVAVIVGIALVVLVRFVGLFFDSVGRGETEVEWLPADLAAPTSLLVRAGIVLSFFIVAAPLVTGDDQGTLARVGIVAVIALGLSVTPLLASVAVGVAVVYGRRFRVDDFAEIGGRAGRVRAITLLETRLEDERGHEIRVPHLLGLTHPVRVLGPARPVTVVLNLATSTIGQSDVRELLLEAAGTLGQDARIDLLAFDADGARYGVSIVSSAPHAETELRAVLAEVLTITGVPLGRPAIATAVAEALASRDPRVPRDPSTGRDPRPQAS
ncbi:mechanosensitive ion channel domain-containing protein [Chondromyces apiculatus]|uniref:mechanosensitive ion channel domain-containing protein n=1 Tax=Chondromyces apiculatus TaxID=51 RepID=UPI0012DD1270|nr:mechanosensitive ion channel domain-containing protein [Chondromyces apiculatus]